MTLYPHLSFNGNCEEAFRLYASLLGGEIVYLLHYGERPSTPADHTMAGKVAHLTFQLGPNRLSGADVSALHYKRPQGLSLQLNLSSHDDARRIYAALSEDGSIRLPLQPTYWADLYADLSDRFGTPWEINCSAKG